MTETKTQAEMERALRATKRLFTIVAWVLTPVVAIIGAVSEPPWPLDGAGGAFIIAVLAVIGVWVAWLVAVIFLMSFGDGGLADRTFDAIGSGLKAAATVSGRELPPGREEATSPEIAEASDMENPVPLSEQEIRAEPRGPGMKGGSSDEERSQGPEALPLSPGMIPELVLTQAALHLEETTRRNQHISQQEADLRKLVGARMYQVGAGLYVSARQAEMASDEEQLGRSNPVDDSWNSLMVDMLDAYERSKERVSADFRVGRGICDIPGPYATIANNVGLDALADPSVLPDLLLLTRIHLVTPTLITGWLALLRQGYNRSEAFGKLRHGPPNADLSTPEHIIGAFFDMALSMAHVSDGG